MVPDALLRRPTEVDAMYKDHLHDVKIIHMGPSTYSDAMVKEKGVARSANARANKGNGQYLTKARKLDTRNASRRNPTWRRGPSSGSSDRTRECAVSA